MEGEALKEGKDRVRQALIEPLIRAGMVRRSGATLPDHAAMMDRLEARLAYMSPEMLLALAEIVERHADGKAKNVWPAEVSICNWARDLEPPPPSESRLVRSYMQSSAGALAYGEGYALELFLYLKKFGRPPVGSYAIDTIKADADRNSRRANAVQNAIDCGRASEMDAAWLVQYRAAQKRCVALILDKEAAA